MEQTTNIKPLQPVVEIPQYEQTRTMYIHLSQYWAKYNKKQKYSVYEMYSLVETTIMHSILADNIKQSILNFYILSNYFFSSFESCDKN